jgi:hypothetical protein
MNGLSALEMEKAMGSTPSTDASSATPVLVPEAVHTEEPPEIIQLVPAQGWWVDRPFLDSDTGAVASNRMRAIAFALCRLANGAVEMRVIDSEGQIGLCTHLHNEADAGLLMKYKKRVRAAANGEAEPEEKKPLGSSPFSNSRGPGVSEKPDEMRLKHLKTALYEGLQWVSTILDKDPGDDLLRHCRQQLRWMQSAVENERRPTISELGQLTLTATIVPELQEDDPYLAQMLAEIEDLYRDL